MNLTETYMFDDAVFIARIEDKLAVKLTMAEYTAVYNVAALNFTSDAYNELKKRVESTKANKQPEVKQPDPK